MYNHDVELSVMESLTNREEQVLQLIIEGYSTKQIAARLEMSFKTAACHRYHILDKFGARNTADLVRRALRLGSRQRAPVDSLANLVAACSTDIRESGAKLRAELAQTRNLVRQSRALRDEMTAMRLEVHRKCLKLVETRSQSTSAAPSPPAPRLQLTDAHVA